MELIPGQLTDGDVTSLPPLPEDRRAELLPRFARKTRRAVRPVSQAVGSEYWFYVGYAANDRDMYLEMFVRDLETELRVLSGRSGSLCFFASSSLQPGDASAATEAQALAASRVLVSMCSPSYFRSEFAGKMVSLFLDRSGKTPGPAYSRILLVIWVREEMPRVFQTIQYMPNDLPDVYWKEGLRYMMRLKRYQDDYREVVGSLARFLADLGKDPPPPLENVPPLNIVPNAFGELSGAGPRYVDFFLLPSTAGSSREHVEQWNAFGEQSMERLALETAEGARFYSSIISMDDITESMEKARRANRIVVIVTDALNLYSESNATVFARLSGLIAGNCAVIAIWSSSEESQRLRAQGDPKRFMEGLPVYYADSAEQFRSVLEKLLHEIRLRIVQQGELMNRIGEVPQLPKIR